MKKLIQKLDERPNWAFGIIVVLSSLPYAACITWFVFKYIL